MIRVPAFVMPLLIVIAVALAGFLTWSHPIENTFPVHRVLAEQLRHGRAESDFTPLGYPWLLSRVPARSIDAAVRVVHFSCYLALAVTVGSLVRRADRWTSLTAVAATAFILFNPYVLLNLYRLNDTNLSMCLTLALFAMLLALEASATRPTVAAAGVVLAVLTFVRPNAITLFPALAFATWRSDVGTSPRALASRLVTAGVVATIAYAMLSLVVARAPFFWPSNGPYNLFAGNNPAAYEVLEAEYNAETSLDEGLQWCGVAGAVRNVPNAAFLKCTLRFLRESPVAEVAVTVFKAYNLLWRPNLRLADSTVDVIAQLVMIVPSLLWTLASLIVLIRQRDVMDPLASVFVVMFALPLVLTNTDPRFRLPLDPIFVLSLASPAVMARLGASVAPPLQHSTAA